jgi:hypothetical protein
VKAFTRSGLQTFAAHGIMQSARGLARSEEAK